MTEKTLDSQVAVITGGSRGIGREVARALAMVAKKSTLALNEIVVLSISAWTSTLVLSHARIISTKLPRITASSSSSDAPAS